MMKRTPANQRLALSTRCIHGTGPSPDATGAIVRPIYQTATFAHPGVNQSTGYDYSRVTNPTRQAFESTMASLESGWRALAFTSGMAAIATILELFKPGDHIVVGADLYGGTHRLIAQVSAKNGLRFSAGQDTAAIIAAIRPRTAAILVETPSNPMMRVIDIAATGEAAHKAGARLIVDNTFLTPYFQRPLELGADLVIHSASKYLAGHNDTIAGLAVAADPALGERLEALRSTIGGALAPFDSWLCLRGLKTLAVRLERQAATANGLADWLRHHPGVSAVYYPGLSDHPDYDVSQRQASGHGAVVSFRVDTAARAAHLLSAVRLIQFAESLGGTESLLTYPLTQTHADMTEEQRQAVGIDGRLLRLSVGLEEEADLRADLRAALG
ncbi:MAG: PLP-dependent aspartate aminotransferase family protein [Bifidobacteriaceae bacterium]|jgi:cystathionine beta-lyase/cystathionine gamma-synthase|nr:PLP-dependent aspartate aminotransferase family protein [Bifidobacteriaceae bacterium]